MQKIICKIILLGSNLQSILATLKASGEGGGEGGFQLTIALVPLILILNLVNAFEGFQGMSLIGPPLCLKRRQSLGQLYACLFLYKFQKNFA